MADLDMGNCVAEEDRVENGDSSVKCDAVEGEENDAPVQNNNMDLAAFEDKLIPESQKMNDDSHEDNAPVGRNLIDIGDFDPMSGEAPVTGSVDETNINVGNVVEDNIVDIGNTNGANDMDDLLGGGECATNQEPPEAEQLIEDFTEQKSAVVVHEDIESDSELTETADAIENGVQEIQAVGIAIQEDGDGTSDEINQASEKVLVSVFDNIKLNQAEDVVSTEPEPTPEPQQEQEEAAEHITGSEDIPEVGTHVPTEVASNTTSNDSDIRKGPEVKAAVKAREEARNKAAAATATKSPQMFIPSRLFTSL